MTVLVSWYAIMIILHYYMIRAQPAWAWRRRDILLAFGVSLVWPVIFPASITWWIARRIRTVLQ